MGSCRTGSALTAQGATTARLVALIFTLIGLPAAQAADPAATPEPSASIVVTAEKLELETRIDRKVYRIKSDVQSSFGSLSDVLSVLPSVDVDADGTVALRGDSNVLILVDGKPATQFSGAAAGDNLQTFPASEIERIEVITNPPPEYKAEGAAGIINIITRKRHQPGVAGTLQASLGSGGRSVVGGNASYASGPLTAGVSATYREDLRRRSLFSDLTAPDPKSGAPTTSTSSIDETIPRNAPLVTLSGSYALNPHQLLSVELSRGSRSGLRTYAELDGTSSAGVVSSATQRQSAGHDREIDGDGKLIFTQRFARPGETLDVTLHRAASHQHEHYDYVNDSLVPPAPAFYNNLGFHEDRGTSELSADYVLPLAQTRSLKLGYAFEQDDYEYGAAGYNVDPVSGMQVINPTLTDDFRFRQQIHALYASYRAGIGRWNWLTGVRGELTHTDGRQLTQGVSTRKRYLQLYPSVHLERALSDLSTLSLAASRRVAYPSPGALNPYVDYEYTPNLRSGNADLMPQYTQSYELGYGYEGSGLSYSVTGYFRRNQNSVTDFTENLGNGLSLATKTNLPKNDSAGTEFAVSGRLLQRLSYALSGNLFYSQIDATALGTPGLRSTTGLNTKVKLDYRSGPNAAQFTLTRTDKRLTPQGYVSASVIVNLGYRYRFSDHLTAVMTAADVFNGQRFERFAVTPAFTNDYHRSVRGRVVYAGVVYAFGASWKEKPPSFEYDQSAAQE